MKIEGVVTAMISEYPLTINVCTRFLHFHNETVFISLDHVDASHVERLAIIQLTVL